MPENLPAGGCSFIRVRSALLCISATLSSFPQHPACSYNLQRPFAQLSDLTIISHTVFMQTDNELPPNSVDNPVRKMSMNLILTEQA
ncbi:hypothetical protein [Aliamphritea hakodatensis]|uniref:hypothetical protein n=1 Tax=Aliamphritea hakodatensis TaxID=2895352 RepID=UPI0022FD4274|nr:hypothetical protein [Aliamphritea hakodatensis]